MTPASVEQFQRRAEYLDICHESWKSVFDSYDKLLRTLKSMSSEISDDILLLIQETRKQVEAKKSELDDLVEENLQKVRAGFLIEQTKPVAFKCDNLNIARVLRQAWPQCTSKISPAPSSSVIGQPLLPSQHKVCFPPPGFSAPIQYSGECATSFQQHHEAQTTNMNGNSQAPGSTRSALAATNSVPSFSQPFPVEVTTYSNGDLDDFDTFASSTGSLSSTSYKTFSQPPAQISTEKKEPKKSLNDIDSFKGEYSSSDSELNDFDTFAPNSSTGWDLTNSGALELTRSNTSQSSASNKQPGSNTVATTCHTISTIPVLKPNYDNRK